MSFHDDVLRIVRAIPPGRVMSYGQIALYLGDPKGSREVGWAMHALGGTDDFPWWRVLNNEGKITVPEKPDASPVEQQELLEAEGVVFLSPGQLAMDQYRHKAERSELEALGLSSLVIESALEKYGERPATGTLGI